MSRIRFYVAAFGVASILSAATKSVTFKVQGWTCGSCASATRIALKKLDGVESVKTDLSNMEATVAFDDAKVGPPEMVEAIAKLGYKATVKEGPAAPSSRASAEVVLNDKPLSERVSFFEVPLECGAAEGLGCGSASKPVLKVIDRDERVEEARINYSGTVLAVVWKDPSEAGSGVSAVKAAFESRDLEIAVLEGSAREKALKEFESDHWYSTSEVDRLSQREAKVIATRLVDRAKMGLPPGKRAALVEDLSAGIAATLTRDREEECAPGRSEDLTEIAKKYLSPQQLAELQKAAERGVRALPGEER
jgi:copper chaperone CopZ